MEVQIRTGWQDSWAQGSEKLGDVWGRWLRYGLPAEGANSEERAHRTEVIQAYAGLSDAIHAHERAIDRRFLLERRLDELRDRRAQGDASDSMDESPLADLLDEARAAAAETNRELAEKMTALARLSGLESDP